MRHRKAGVHLSRTSAHRKALFSNLVAALLTNERIRTTDAKAKETRRLAERTISWARRVSDVLVEARLPDHRGAGARGSRRPHGPPGRPRPRRGGQAVRRDFAPRFEGRRGGYTRIVKLGQRPGDAAPMSLLELMPDQGALPPPAETSPSKGAEGEKGKGKAKAKTAGAADKSTAADTKAPKARKTSEKKAESSAKSSAPEGAKKK